MYYVVTETNFEYNDEYHQVVDGGGGVPVGVFKDRATAEADARARTIKALKEYGNSLIDGWVYGYGVNGVFEAAPSFIANHDQFWNMTYDDATVILDLANRSDEELNEVAACLNMQFFTVTEVVGGQS